MTLNQGRDPVAVVGAACRLPGAHSITELWDVLREGRDVVGTIPADRFADESERGRTPGVLRGAGGYLDDITGFDSRYFGVSPFEALRMDPQQRILMETVWEALADAGIPAESLAGTRTGVYTSLLPSGYWDLLRRAGMYDMHAALGAAIPGIFPGRVSTRLDLRGPSMGVEAACATSLLAVHVACRALWNGEADQAIVGGANLQIVPDLYFALADAGVLSSTGQCRFGDVAGDGYVRSEGVAAVVLKPLSRALADGDTPYAVILGSSATHDGRTGGSMVAPGLEGHEEMLRSAYLDAGVAPCDVDYIEAHGPGTRAGDPTELTALDIVLREGRPEDRRCLVGSVKSNLGHTEFNAGLAGLLKTCLAIRHRTIPATLHVDRPHEILCRPYTAVELAMLTQPWPQDERPAIAGISSFGMSGANIHLVLSEAPRPEPRLPAPARPCYVLPVSARDQRALRELAGSYADLLDTGPDLEDLCHTAGVRTTRHELGIAAVGADAAELAAALRQAGEGDYARREPKVVFVFPGQGAQWTGMGRDLLDRLPAFGHYLDSCARAVQAELGWSPAELLRQERPLEHVDQIQPTIWAMQVALASVWREWGVEPDLLIGHSMGEIAAAVVSGALSVADGAAVVCRRSRVLRESHARGAMWAIGLGEEAAREAIGDHADQVCVGVVNSSHSTVLSGEAAVLDEVVAPLLARGVFGKRVQVDYASHAPQVDPMREPLLRELRDLRPETGAVPIHSTAWDAPLKGEEMDAGYWFENLRLPVRFAAAARAALTQERPTVFVEISPHPLLRPALEDEIEASGARGAVVASLERGRPETDALHAALGRAYELGCRPAWERLYPQGGHLPLPAYPWQRRRFWPDQAGTVLPPEPPAPEQPARTYDLAGMPDTEVAGVVAGLAAQVLAVPGHDIGVDVPLTLLGLDSVLATRFRDRLRRDLGVEVPVRLLLGPSTLLELAARLRAD